MSFVVCVSIFDRGTYLVGDKRVSALTDNGFVPLSDKSSKIFSLSKYAAVGFTGDYNVTLSLRDMLLNYVRLSPLGLVFADEIASVLQKYLLSQPQDIIQHKIYAVITGVDSSNHIRTFMLDGPKGFILSDESPTPENKIRYTYSGDGPNTGKELQQRLKIVFQTTSDQTLDKDILSALSQHVVYVSERTNTVGPTADYIFIARNRAASN